MYLLIVFLVLNIFVNVCRAECGCGTDRNFECSNDGDKIAVNGGYKYSKKANELDGNNNGKPPKNAFDTTDMVLIAGGVFEMGTKKPVFETDFEGPVRNVSVQSFYLDKYEVSNRNFGEFVEATGYVTEAETFGDSFVFELLLPEKERNEYKDIRAVQAPWWVKLKGASWKHPEGINSDVNDRMNHPVIHISWNDAVKYCRHYGKRLPSEAEWEMACRGGLRQKLYPWGNKLNAKNQHWANIWQGDFPEVNTGEDGFVGTAPIDSFPANKFDLHNMAGNVWEWTQDDWQNNPNLKVKKGGSYLCHESYCWRYRCAARSHNTKDSSAGNLGFRCAASAEKT